MTPESLMKSRVNTVFLLMCLTLAAQMVASLPVSLFSFLAVLGIELNLYYTEFVLIQFLYPIINFVMALLVLRIIRIPVKTVAPVKPLKADFVPWLGIFMGISVVMNYFVTGILWVFEQIGFTIPDVLSDYNPSDIPQAICFFIILAILPPISEEILCRVCGTGLLKNFHPWTAVFISAFAFGLMHATLQQIPFAFVLGLVLGFVYVKTGNILYPILFHFANNAWSCVLTYLTVWSSENITAFVSYGADILFLIYGIASLIWLLCKKQFTLREIPHSLEGAAAGKAVVKSPFFWIFTGIYSVMTVMNLGLPYLIELIEQYSIPV